MALFKFSHGTQPAYLSFDTTHTIPVRNNRKTDLKEVGITRMTHKDGQALIVKALTRTLASLEARICGPVEIICDVLSKWVHN